MTKCDIKLVITDLDDTLWEWCTSWHEMFNGFNDSLSTYGVDDTTLDRLWAKTYARRNGETIEFPPDLDDVKSFTDLNHHSEIAWKDAFVVSRARRDASFRMFDTVHETFAELKRRGVTVVAHTDSPVSAAEYRLHHAGLDGAVHSLYGRPVFTPFGDAPSLQHTVPFHVTGWKSKPSTTVVEHILHAHRVQPQQVLYVGDSMRRDMAMASAAGLNPVWASYGTNYPEREPAIESLVRVQRLHPFPPDASMVNEPNRNGHTVISSFSEVLDLL